MSLILEALRKSEAERRRGQVPGLHAELPPAARPTRQRSARWSWLAALGVIVSVAATWLLLDRWTPAPPASAPARASSEPATPAGADRTAAGAPVTDPASPTTTAPPAPVADPPKAPRQRPEPVVSTAPSRDREAAAAVSESSNPLPAPDPTASATTSATTPPADATETGLDDSAPLRLSDLAAAERRALPPLRVSMHMWAPTTSRRFAIIDGARVNEGDRLGDAVVDEITRDGVVLAWHGRRVHIPIH